MIKRLLISLIEIKFKNSNRAYIYHDWSKHTISELLQILTNY